MKRLILLTLMLRVWWDPCGGCDIRTGVLIQATGHHSITTMLIRLDNGKVEDVMPGEVTNSKWEEVKS